MASPIYNEEHRQAASRDVVSLARNILGGELGVVAGARRLCWMYREVGVEVNDPDFVFFVAVNSETDHLPLGEVRKLWNPEALRVKDAELAAYEARKRDEAFEICRRLILRYESHDA